MPTHHANMADVAREAGVSVATVSRALRDLPGVGEETRQRIKDIAERLRYVVSPEASALSGGATRRVAVVVSRIDYWFYGSMVAALEETLRQAGHDVLLYQISGAEQRRRFFDELPARRKADALVVVALPVPEEQARRLDLLGMHVVVAGGQVLDYPRVGIDDHEVGLQAVGHLVELGHRKIAMIRTEDPEGAIWQSDLGRTAGYRDALERAGIAWRDDYVATVPFGSEGGAVAMQHLLDLADPPTAVFAHSDEVATGALRTLRREGIAVPGQVSIIGVDDHPLAELVDLTTVRQPVTEQGHLAGRLVLDLLAETPPTEPTLLVPTHVVVRGTTGPPPA